MRSTTYYESCVLCTPTGTLIPPQAGRSLRNRFVYIDMTKRPESILALEPRASTSYGGPQSHSISIPYARQRTCAARGTSGRQATHIVVRGFSLADIQTDLVRVSRRSPMAACAVNRIRPSTPLPSNPLIARFETAEINELSSLAERAEVFLRSHGELLSLFVPDGVARGPAVLPRRVQKRRIPVVRERNHSDFPR